VITQLQNIVLKMSAFFYY